MGKVLPVIIVCSIGIAVCIAYLIFLCIGALRKKKKNSRNEFEIEDNVLTIKLGKRKK